MNVVKEEESKAISEDVVDEKKDFRWTKDRIILAIIFSIVI